MVIDIHVHTSSPVVRYGADEVDELKRLAERAGIDRIVHLFNIRDIGEGPPTSDMIRANNYCAMRLVERNPAFISGFCYLNPENDAAFVRDEIERTVVRGNLCGIKLWVWVKATDPRLDPIMEYAAELGVPVLYHAWYKATEYAFNESTPAEIAHLARRHPGVRLIMAHMGGGGWRGVMDVKDCPNVWVDTSGSQPGTGLLEYAVQQLGAERILFGSDWPGRNMAVQKARVVGAKITEKQKELILGGNAARLLDRVGGEEVETGA